MTWPILAVIFVLSVLLSVYLCIRSAINKLVEEDFLMRTIFMVMALFAAGSMASATTMNCIAGLYRASNMKDNAKVDEKKVTKLVSVEIRNGEGSAEIEVNGETVVAEVLKKPHADVYEFFLTLSTPEADRPKGAGYVAVMQDWLVNGGPARNDGFSPGVKPGSTRYEYLKRPVGALLITPKLREALNNAGKWGKYPFDSSIIDVTNSHLVAEAVQELLENRKLRPRDVVVMNTAYACTLHP